MGGMIEEAGKALEEAAEQMRKALEAEVTTHLRRLAKQHPGKKVEFLASMGTYRYYVDGDPIWPGDEYETPDMVEVLHTINSITDSWGNWPALTRYA